MTGPQPPINLSLTISVLTPLTIGASSAARAGNRAVAARERPRAALGSLTVVGFGSFRGDADVSTGACLGCETVALKASLPRADCRRFCRCRIALLVAAAKCGASASASTSASADTDADGDCGKLRERSLAAVAARQSGNAAALSPAGADATCYNRAAAE